MVVGVSFFPLPPQRGCRGVNRAILFLDLGSYFFLLVYYFLFVAAGQIPWVGEWLGEEEQSVETRPTALFSLSTYVPLSSVGQLVSLFDLAEIRSCVVQ